VTELLKHPQAHFINVRSMELLKAEVPRVYEKVLEEMPGVDEWDGFHFGGGVLQSSDNDGDDGGDRSTTSGGRRLGRVIHPVRQRLKVGQRGDAILVPKANSNHANVRQPPNNGTFKIQSQVDDDDDADYVSACRPAHLAQNKFVNLLLQEAQRHALHEENDVDGVNRDCNEDEVGNNQHHHHRLRYGEEVVHIAEHSPSSNSTIGSSNNVDNDEHHPPIITIQTSKGQFHRTRYLLACDGVHSFVRRHCNIPMMGDANMQNLINVHFRTNANLSKLLMKQKQKRGGDDRAMLHFVYNSKLVGAFVCHDGNTGEWVLQIPFFPPFQTMEHDFKLDKVKDMIWAGLLGNSVNSVNNTLSSDAATNLDLEILSIRPWTMASLVAQRYLNESNNMILVGDAAHAFPPAGGFGMNTGLQDAHDIAWRLALLLNKDKKNSDDNGTTASSSSKLSTSSNILTKYDSERRPVATQNAALSVRNFQRTLRIAKACYLDAQHPQLLISILQSPPANFLPLSARQEMFRRLVDVAMMPLGSLMNTNTNNNNAATAADGSKSSSSTRNFHANHIENNVRSILENGGSLPLVFPRYELGFSYSPTDNDGDDDDNDGSLQKEMMDSNGGGDTAGYFPVLKVGHRMPHVMVDVLAGDDKNGKDNGDGWADMESLHPQTKGSNDNSRHLNDGKTISMSLMDISSQWRRVHSHPSPVFTLFAFGPLLTEISSSCPTEEAVNCAVTKWKVPIVVVNVLSSKPCIHEHLDGNSRSTTAATSDGTKGETRNSIIHAVESQQALLELLHSQKATQNNISGSGNDNAIIMARPDGHIASIAWIDKGRGAEGVSEQIQQAVEEGFYNALGDCK